ncbi:MAG: hypothetical protein LBD35_06380, partial [Prevotellaceae bacterium]|nr:hypothetical protein [Prevotellaceae bacterium]
MRRYALVAIFALLAAAAGGQAPPMPEIRSLSVDPITGAAILKWKPVAETDDVTAFEVSEKLYINTNYFFQRNAYLTRDNSVYVKPHDDIATQRYSYRMRSVNDLNTSPITDMHITMQFSGTYNQCDNTLDLRWTEYRRYAINEYGQISVNDAASNAYNNAIEYEVWGKWGYDGARFDIDSAVKLSDREKTFNVLLENVERNTKYFLFVKAFLPTGDTATSHGISIDIISKRLPAVMNIDSVISDQGMINLYLNVDKSTDLDTFAIYRSDSRIPISWFYSAADIPARFSDKTAFIGQVYNYCIAGFTCGQRIIESDTASNIILYATPYNLSTEIRWTEFVNQSRSVVYTLTRTAPAKLTLAPGNSLHYIDESTFEFVCTGPQRFCYVMRAATSTSTARSEEACVSLTSMITMPEAIDPLSEIIATKSCNCNTNCVNHRRLFGPVTDLDDDAYRMELEIFDKSGVKLFSSRKNFSEPLQKEIH